MKDLESPAQSKLTFEKAGAHSLRERSAATRKLDELSTVIRNSGDALRPCVDRITGV